MPLTIAGSTNDAFDASIRADARYVVGFFIASVTAHVSNFAGIYRLLDVWIPGSFSERLSPGDAFYVAITTFTSLGSGQLSPVSAPARAAVTVESILSVLVIAVGVALVLNRYLRAAKEK